jgi:hypothetical protein
MGALRLMTTISAWLLFIHGLAAIAWGGVDMLHFTGGWQLTEMAAISCSIGTANLIMAAIAAWLRHKMEPES